jgi:enamine deaminase RidA (YjgF/YER057c/UK114 family)
MKVQEMTGQGAEKQAEQVLDRLESVLRAGGSDLEKVAKLNIYLAQAEALSEVQKVLARRFSDANKPAARFIITRLPLEALVAMDAVATTSSGEGQGVVRFFTGSAASIHGGISDAAVLPPGRCLYVSGTADTNSLPGATKRTLQKLTAAIGHLGFQKSNVVQLKAFLEPMSKVLVARKAIEDFFGGNAPPAAFVEWSSPRPNPPIEIELIAGGTPTATNESESVTFLTPAGTTSTTKVFSRVAQVNHGKLIYISELMV